ncbi:GNAT family N-acetyltransferase [Thalassotalea sp. M1531]|uniref:GNAT family N-acetyltransferase n=1 Tax=Thalassotalea algicola TaxID=2716224 RepID=A0A7Y0LCP0_9GAMM|nr:GNAT family N-acetyltransferase [Thalassotalea algicola]NMP32006.1 GNAT family N-acetyltransferase [Thalassotalea algicola]
MINELDNSNVDVANQIFTVFQNSYQIEAQLIGVSEFPPLSRTLNEIMNSATRFYGCYENSCLAGVIEIAIKDKRLEIDSLTVDPNYFKKGIASQLIGYAFDFFDFTEAIVETAVANEPAIKLYKKHGFVEFKRWTPSHGIQKLALSIKNTL